MRTGGETTRLLYVPSAVAGHHPFGPPKPATSLIDATPSGTPSTRIRSSAPHCLRLHHRRPWSDGATAIPTPTHLPEAGSALQTVQELRGHRDDNSAMISARA